MVLSPAMSGLSPVRWPGGGDSPVRCHQTPSGKNPSQLPKPSQMVIARQMREERGCIDHIDLAGSVPERWLRGAQ